MKDRNNKEKEFERRIRLFLSQGTPRGEQDVLRAWLMKEDEDSGLKRDILCRVMVEQLEEETGPGDSESTARKLGMEGLDPHWF